MKSLFDHVADALAEPTNIDLLSATSGLTDRRVVVSGSLLTAAVLLGQMAEMAAEPDTVGAIGRGLNLVAGADLQGPVLLVAGQWESAGSWLGVLLDGSAVARTVADTGMEEASAAALVPPIAWLMAAAMDRHQHQQLDRTTLQPYLAREHRIMADREWHRWLDVVAPAAEVDTVGSSSGGTPPPTHRRVATIDAPRPAEPTVPGPVPTSPAPQGSPTTEESVAAREPVAPIAEESAPQEPAPQESVVAASVVPGSVPRDAAALLPRAQAALPREPMPAQAPASTPSKVPGPTAEDTAATRSSGRQPAVAVSSIGAAIRTAGGDHASRSASTPPSTPTTTDKPRRASSPTPSHPPSPDDRSDLTRTIVTWSFVLLGAVIWLLIARALGSDDVQPGLVAGISGDAAAEADVASSTTVAARPVDPDPATEGDDAAGLVEIMLSLDDTSGGTGATGTAEIVLDPNTNRICHRFEVEGIDPPFEGRLGVGLPWVRGGVVADLGVLVPGERACTSVSSAVMEAMLSGGSDHFVELNEVDSTVGVRAEFAPDAAERTGADLVPIVESEFDPSGSGAVTIARSGVLTLTGAVADPLLAQLLRDELAVLEGTDIQVVDELTVDPAAPAPTGGFRVDQGELFAVGSSELSSGGQTVVRELAVLFLLHPEWSIIVSGHTDSTGNERGNLELGLQRANVVRDLLIGEGVPEEQLSAEGVGAPNPIADNETPEGRAQNRRFEIEIRRR